VLHRLVNHNILTIILIVRSSFLVCQANYPAPSGVWCSCPPSNGIGYGSVVPSIAEKEYVQGILVRVVWKDIEPSNDSYNWSFIDNQIYAAQSFGKKIALAIGSGPNSPDWLYLLGAQPISFSIPFNGTIPSPWDAIFLEQWKDFITELGNRYQNDSTIQLVYITNSSTNGFEMQLPFNPTPAYSELNYSDLVMIDSWKQIIDRFNDAFPNHYLTNDFHPVNSSNLIADSVYSYANQTIGNRYGANAWWWTQNNTNIYPSQYTILQNSANTNLFTGLQMAASGIASPSTFGEGGMPAALDLAISNNVCYWEIWNQDISDGTFDAMLSQAICSSLKSKEIDKPEMINLFPNPVIDLLTFQIKSNKIIECEVINGLGQVVIRKTTIYSSEIQLNLSDCTNGLYVLSIKDNLGNKYYKKIVKLN
jgi:hypothetical protein